MICLLQPAKKTGDSDGNTTKNAGSTQMSVLPNAGQSTGESQDVMLASLRSIYADDVEVPLQTIADCGKHLDYHEKCRLRVGIIIHTVQSSHRALAALANPASSCKVTALTVLKPPASFSMNNLAENVEKHFLTPGSIMRQWMRDNNLGNHSESVAVLGGEEGAELIVQRHDVDALFIIVPDEIHRKYALSALAAKKHVLLNDPVSISLQAFHEQLEYARKYGKFVQSSTAFIHQYRVRQFMECVLREGFGRVTSMDATLSVCSKDLELVGVNQPPLPIGLNQGCIRRLGRYCVLFSILLFTKLGSHPTSAQVHSAVVDQAPADKEDKDQAESSVENATRTQKARVPEPIRAQCTVKYSDDRKLTFTVDYSSASATRQRLEVKAGATMATMSDFVFPHPDGLATYRVYEDAPNSALKGDIEVMHGEAIDIAGGPKHDVMMWRKFAELSRTIDEAGWDDADSPLTERVRELAEITLHTKTILNALMKSYEEGFIEVPLDRQ